MHFCEQEWRSFRFANVEFSFLSSLTNSGEYFIYFLTIYIKTLKYNNKFPDLSKLTKTVTGFWRRVSVLYKNNLPPMTKITSSAKLKWPLFPSYMNLDNLASFCMKWKWGRKSQSVEPLSITYIHQSINTDVQHLRAFCMTAFKHNFQDFWDTCHEMSVWEDFVGFRLLAKCSKFA